MQKKHQNKNLVILAVTGEPRSKVAPFVKDNKINYIVGAGAEKALTAYRIRGFPTVLVIGADGEIAYRGHNPLEAEKVAEEKLKEISSEDLGGIEESAAKSAYDKALKLYKKKDYAKALKAFGAVTKNFKGTEAAGEAAAKIKKMKASKKIMAKILKADADRKCEDWLDAARSLVKMDKTKEAAEYYQRIIDEYPDSSFAKIARKEMATLRLT